ncbi:MAG: Nif3-like dinuclear metal center hexameric protein [Culicoidibacterales bacterium]
MAKKTLVGQELIKHLELLYPKAIAMEKDPIGLQLGSLNKPVKKILLALDVDQRVCDEAVSKGVDLIIAHHPFIYMPLQQLQLDTPKGKIIAQLIKNDMSVYAAHTNLDIAENGLNDWMASRLGLTQTQVLSATGVDAQGVEIGLGRIGQLPSPMQLETFVEVTKQAFNLSGLRIVGARPMKEIRRVAVLGGSGSSYWRQAKMKKADIYVTGDVGYHDAQEAVESRMMIADVGHYAEHVCKEHLHKIIAEFIKGNDYDAQVSVTTSEADPFEIW